MSNAATTYQLIIRQRPMVNPDLENLVHVLENRCGLDSFLARQRLTGPGLAMFDSGALEDLHPISTYLQETGLAHWMVPEQTPQFAPDRMRGLEIHDGHILFDCAKVPVRLERNTFVVGILADISGKLVEKHMKRLMAGHLYQGTPAVGTLGREEMTKTILQGQAVFDFYLLDQQAVVKNAVRVLPGRFNIEGLGARATMSAQLNLQAIVALVEEYAQPFRLYLDFGLSQLPSCQVKSLSQSPAAVMENLDSLTRYGWLMTQLEGAGLGSKRKPANPMNRTTGLSAIPSGSGAVLGLPTGQAFSLESIERSSNAAKGHEQGPGGEQSESVVEPVRCLPQPPQVAEGQRRLNLKLLGGIIACIAVTVVSGGGELFQLFVNYGLSTGAVPAAAAMVLAGSGFYCLRLKRRMENTPTSKVRSIAMGMVEVHGRARRKYALVAPMTQTACVWYRLRKYRKDSKDRWRKVKELDSGHVPFQIEDGTGRVTVAPFGARITPKVRQVGYPGHSSLNFMAFGGRCDEDEKWIEDLIYEGTSLYVLGYAQPIRNGKPGLRARIAAKLRQLKLDRKALDRYDVDGNGTVTAAEWDTARHAAEQDALREHLSEQVDRQPQETHVVIGKPAQGGLPFVIAETLSEKHLTRKYGWIGGLLLTAGLAGSCTALYKFMKFFST